MNKEVEGSLLSLQELADNLDLAYGDRTRGENPLKAYANISGKRREVKCYNLRLPTGSPPLTRVVWHTGGKDRHITLPTDCFKKIPDLRSYGYEE